MKKNSFKIIRVIIVLMGLLLVSKITYGQCPQTTYCGGIIVSVTQDADNLGCFLIVDFKHNWTSCDVCNVADLPHGLYIKLTGATINSFSYPIPSWLTSAVQNPSILTDNIYWNKIPTGNCSSHPNAIPSNQSLQVKIRISSVSNTTPISVQVHELTGWSWPNDITKWSCEKVFNFSAPLINYNIGADIDTCRGSALTLNILPNPGTVLSTKWYKYVPTSTTDPCPSVNPWSSLWGSSVQNGGITYNTNIMNNTACYVAVVDKGCWTYISNVRRITICQGMPGATSIVSAPISPFLPLQNINSEWHACTRWKGTLSFTLLPNDCTPSIVWERQVNGSGPWVNVGNNVLSINTDTLKSVSACSTKYAYRVRLTNACGTNPLTYTIVIDHKPDGGIVKTLTTQSFDVGIGTNTAPIICYDRGTRLWDSTTCGKVKRWEYREDITKCSYIWGAWTPIAGSENTYIWWTNNLTRSRQYKALLENGACMVPSNSAYSSIITVKVKPKLTVNITTTSNLLCTNPALTAHTPYDSCGYTVAYQWYRNGSVITGATGASHSPTQPGKYSVIVKDNQCNTFSSSDLILICSSKLSITGPCCICLLPPYTTGLYETITLSADMIYTPSACGPSPTYLWSTGATTQTININHPGNYSVTVHIGSCVFTGSYNVTVCPHH